MEVCCVCNKEPGARYVTCSAHKERRTMCERHFAEHSERARDGCDVSGYHGRVHAVRRSRVLRSFEYFRQRGKTIALATMQVLLFMSTLAFFMGVIIAPYILILAKEDDPKVVFREASMLSCVLYMTQNIIHSAFCFCIWLITFVEWADHKGSVMRNTLQRASMYHITAVSYGTQVTFGLLLYVSPDRELLVVYLACAGFLVLDAMFLLMFRQPIWDMCRQAAVGVRDWFTEDLEEHFYTGDAS